MFRKILSKLAALSITTKIIIGIVTVAIVFGLIMFGATQLMDAPDNQDLQPGQQADIMDADDVEKDGIFKEFFSNIIDIITGNDHADEEIRYVVKFKTNGGGEIKDKSVVAGTNISKLPTPNRNGYIFLGWFYDRGLEKAVESDDTVNKNMTLYASYLEQTPLDTLERVNFAAAENVGKDFTIKVLSSDSTMSARDVKASLTAVNLTNPATKNFIKVTEVDDGFVISGIKESKGMGTSEGFEEGATYTIKLNSDALSFDGYPETAREFNFTTYKEEVLNFKLNDDITFIPASDLKNITNNGQTVSTLDIALYTVRNDGSMSAADLTEGTFEYTKGALKVGEIVSVYDGLIPTERTLDTPADQLGDIGYVEITSKNGNKYSYKSAQAEDIIFTPDMLPVPEGVDLDKKASTITVDDKYFDYSKDFYASMDLDSQTTVDVGDFLVFYTGNLEVTQGKNAAERKGFAEVTGVTKNDNGTTTVKYKEVSWDYVDSSMDVYTQDEMTADELLEGINKEEVEAEIEQQAIDSGFVEEAAQYLASLSLATDNFSKLSDNMNLEDYKVVLKDGTPVTPEQLNLMSGGISAQVADTKVKATVSRKPSHLGNVAGTNADKEGIAISLEVISVITIDSADDEGELEITVTGKFVEEIGFDYGASSDTEWDWAVIIPYIKEWTVSANIDLMNYTGLEITATMVTKEADDDSIFGEAANIAEEIKALLEKNTNPETGDDYHTKLVEKYSEMVHADSDWIRIVEINIFEFDKHLPPALPIIHLEVTVDFVIQMDASVAVGFEFEYLEGERYVFNVRITEGDITSNSVSLKEKTYELNFYTMGRMAIKAGVELEFKVGLFSTKLANIGFDAGAGPYTKLYGYFYYELKYTESMGRSQNYSGALLTQVGVYFHLGLNAEAIGGKYSSSVDLVDEEWLLWQAGRRDNVLDFATEQKDLPKMVMRQYVRRVQLPDNVFNMLYLDLITGDDKNAIYNDWNDPDREDDFRNGENYSIKMTNDKFSYDPKTNEIVVRADEEDIKIEGEMIITWKQKPMSFSSKPLQRRVKLYWDNLRDGYMIVPYTNGGSYVPLIAKGYEEKVTQPSDPTKLGYIFDGWYTDEEFTKPYTFPKAMPNKDTNIYAKWEAATDIPYTVEHYLENFKSGEYELVETETFEGTTDTYVSPAVNYYEGYASPEVQEVKVEADGSGVLRYYYKLQRGTVTFDSGLDGKEDSTFTLKYGARISAPKMSAKGYEFKGWTIDGTTVVIPESTMGTENLSYTAMWDKKADTEYRVEYYVQQIDGSYKLQHFVTETDETGAVLNEADLRAKLIDGVPADEKYTNKGIKPENMTVRGVVCEDGTATVTGDGRLVVKINYSRNINDISFDPAYEGATPIVTTAYYQQAVTKPEDPTRVGYTFAGWDDTATEAVEAVTPITTMIEKPVTYNALWTPNVDTKYTVKHYLQNLDNLDEYTLKDTDNLKGTTATDVTPDTKDYKGFKAPEKQTKAIAADGSMVVKYYYSRNTYTVTLEANGGKFVNAEGSDNGETQPDATTITRKFLYGESLSIPTPTRAGYGFGGWQKDDEAYTVGTMPATNITLTAKWEAGKIAYTTYHWQQNIGGGNDLEKDYTIAKTDFKVADMDSNVTPPVNNYTGFTSPDTTTIKIKADEKLNVVNYYYTRNKHSLTWDFNGGKVGEQTSISDELYYGETITVPKPVKKGYSYTWDSKPVSTMPDTDLEYKANWTVNSYKVSFDLDGGTVKDGSVDTRTVAFDSDYGELATLEKHGYTFEGWCTADGTKVEADTVLKTDKDHTLYADYKLILNPISYKFIDSNLGVQIDGVSNSDNPEYYSVEDYKFVLANPEKDGYTFKGWYLDYVDGQFTNPISGEINFADYHGRTLYAEFDPHGYTVEFYQGTENESPARHDLYFGETLSLSEYSTYISGNKAGYTLLGWSTEPDSTVAEYGINGVVSNLTTEEAGTAKLYAVWKLNVYTINYNMGAHTTETSVDYVKEYSIETTEDITLPTPTGKSGFVFGGWYTDAEFTNPISKIAVKSAMTDYELYAKWEHGGKFSIAYTGKSGDKAVYTITRTIPEGAFGTQAVQNVYVRTLNGTAYGSTYSISGSEDKYHFIHKSDFLEFGPNDNEKTITVTENDSYLSAYIPASYQIGNKARNYYMEIYKVEDTTGGSAGTIGTGRVTRTMDIASSYNLSTLYNSWYTKELSLYGTGRFQWSWEIPCDVDGTDSVIEKYAETLGIDDNWGLRAEITMTKKSERISSAYVDFSKNRFSTLSKYFSVFVKEGTATISFPDQTIIAGTVEEIESGPDRNGWKAELDDGKTFLINSEDSITLLVETGRDLLSGNQNSFDRIALKYKIYDDKAPVLKYVAPIALTNYAKGDEVMLAVIYSEPLNAISGKKTLTLSSRLSEYFESPTYVNNGTGTNTVVFNVKAKKNISADDAQKINEYLVFTESTVGGSFSTNIGSLSITVKDIMGN